MTSDQAMEQVLCIGRKDALILFKHDTRSLIVISNFVTKKNECIAAIHMTIMVEQWNDQNEELVYS